jgi:hypothetical protein
MDDETVEAMYSIDKRVEVSEMAGLFLGWWGEKLFFIVIVVSLPNFELLFLPFRLYQCRFICMAI